MVQHVVITSSEQANPPMAILWRDDQTLKWSLAPGLCWPAAVEQPIVFLPADPSRGYMKWMGSAPTPIGPAPTNGIDRRVYTAVSDKILNPDEEPQMYHYMYAVCPIDNPNCMLPLDPTLDEAPRAQQRQDADGVWHDPEVENQNQP